MTAPTRPPTVSVVMPAYNSREFIGTAIASVVSQSFTDWELLVVDDGSSDGTPEVVAAAARNDSRIRLIALAVNSGNRPAIPRNCALRAATGRFIAFLDSDDSWRPAKLARQVALMDAHPGLVLSYVLFDVIGMDGRVTGPYPVASRRPRGRAFSSLYMYSTVSNSAMMLPRALLDRVGMLDESPLIVEDLDFWLRIATLGPIDFVDDSLVSYRQRKASHSSGFLGPWQRMYAVFRRHRHTAGIRLFITASAYQAMALAKRSVINALSLWRSGGR